MNSTREFIKSGLSVAKSGFDLVSNDQLSKRLAICGSCSNSNIINEKIICNICGCDMGIKAKFSTLNCPVSEGDSCSDVSLWGEPIAH